LTGSPLDLLSLGFDPPNKQKENKKMNNQNEWEENECNPGAAGEEKGLDSWGNYTGKWDEVTGEWTWWDKEE
jgi:hypothetical protein